MVSCTCMIYTIMELITGSLLQQYYSTYPKDLVNFFVPTALSLKTKEFRIQTSKRLIFFKPEYGQEQHC